MGRCVSRLLEKLESSLFTSEVVTLDLIYSFILKGVVCLLCVYCAKAYTDNGSEFSGKRDRNSTSTYFGWFPNVEEIF